MPCNHNSVIFEDCILCNNPMRSYVIQLGYEYFNDKIRANEDTNKEE